MMTKIAILGAGSIAGVMARTLQGMQAKGRPVALYAVASRSLDKAEAFAKQWGFEKAYGSYEDMLNDPAVELVYVATPHSHHAAHTRLCIDHGKAALVEKAFTGNARQARETLAYAEEKGVLVTEAIWTRYMPVRRMVDELLAQGEIGEPRLLTANLGYAIEGKERIFRPELAGGALLDLGVYVLNFASMTFGDDVVRMDSSVSMLDTGVDCAESIDLYYRDGRMAKLYATAAARTDRHCMIYGTNGAIMLDNVNNPQTITIYDDAQRGPVRRVMPVPEQITGYEYEVEACLTALANGTLECPDMPHAQTIHMMDMMDTLRAQWHMTYPFD
ncbi:MAG: Gfo/Idh/MocA family protein [Aristaeellaceae bacterium]